MEVKLREVTVAELVEGYRDDREGGVRGYGGRLDIRPAFQREFVYGDDERNAVIDTVKRGYPLNVMYWADRGDDTYEVIDGQQRTISLGQYMEGEFVHDGLYVHNLDEQERKAISEYPLSVYVCTGTDREKLNWFRTVNIAGVKLTDQELRNAVYSGPWVSDAKRYFSRNGCAAHEKGRDYLNRSAIRQEYLETAIRWISKNKIEDYMGRHQHDTDAIELWEHYVSVIDWVGRVFTEKRRAMKSVDWGPLYDEYKDVDLDPEAIEAETQRLIDDEDVTKHSGIYPFILNRDEKHLSIREFPDAIKRRVYEKQGRKCNKCGESLPYEEMEADHIKPWIEGGRTIEENCQLLCKPCNRRKGSK